MIRFLNFKYVTLVLTFRSRLVWQAGAGRGRFREDDEGGVSENCWGRLAGRRHTLKKECHLSRRCHDWYLSNPVLCNRFVSVRFGAGTSVRVSDVRSQLFLQRLQSSNSQYAYNTRAERVQANSAANPARTSGVKEKFLAMADFMILPNTLMHPEC